MIDTVRFTTSRKVTGPAFRKNGFLKLLKNSAIRVRITRTGNVEYVTTVEASLPKVAFGNNVRLLETKDEFTRAWEEVFRHLDSISENGPIYLTRVDLCWNYQGEPLEFFLAHEVLNHPMIRKAVNSYDDPKRKARIVSTRDSATRTGLDWQGSKIRIRFYDKTKDAKKRGQKEKLIRAEVQLRGSLLRKLLGGDEKQHLQNLPWETCYPVFRNILKKFPNPKVISILDGQDQINLAALDKGIPVLDILGKGRHRTTVHRLRKRLGRVQLRKYRIDWSWMLPEQFPPPKTVIRPPAKPAPRPPKPFKLRRPSPSKPHGRKPDNP